ncbi:MAG: tetratricopeptide repeat protein [Bacteroidota bacterium]
MREGFALLVAACLTLASPVCGQTRGAGDSTFEALARRGIDHVYNLEFEQAEADFQELARLKPGHPAGPFFLAMVEWWKIMTDLDNEQYDRQFLAALDGVITMCDSMLDRNPNDVTAIFFKGGSIGFQGRLQFHRNDYLAAANPGRRALPLVQEAFALDPGNFDILLGTGIYNYYADVIPEEYPLVKPLILFIPPGDRQKGIEQLTLAYRKGTYASVEAGYFLMQIYYFYERDYGKALELARDLTGRFPNNMVFHRYLGRCHVSLNNWEAGEQVFAEIARRAEGGQRGYGPAVEREAQYYLGVAAMMIRRFDEALEHLYRCDALSRTLDTDGASGFMSMANLKIGMIYDCQNKRSLAELQYRKVLDMREYMNSREQAEQFLKTPYAQ